LVDVLGGLATYYLRKRDLVTGSQLLQSLNYMGYSRGPVGLSCLEVVLLQQRPDGAFGYIGHRMPALNAVLSDHQLVDEEVELPFTLACVLALRETLGDGWLLYKCLPKFTREITTIE